MVLLLHAIFSCSPLASNFHDRLPRRLCATMTPHFAILLASPLLVLVIIGVVMLTSTRSKCLCRSFEFWFYMVQEGVKFSGFCEKRRSNETQGISWWSRDWAMDMLSNVDEVGLLGKRAWPEKGLKFGWRERHWRSGVSRRRGFAEAIVVFFMVALCLIKSLIHPKS